ncbi:DUF6781 family protein [Pseudorhodoferax sp.]|uniref:DUF6781 family protein n=1 Tax=Pseudorhodoferax sp. TaxID=1993553 RepID=UPI0039E30680
MATSKLGIDTDALIAQYEQATAQQGQALRKAVQDTTLRALQQRELTLKAIKDVVRTVTEAAAAGAARNTQGVDVEAMLNQTVAGIDDAVRQAVQASQRALQQLLDQGLDLREKQVKKALSDIEKMEDQVFDAMRKATSSEAMAPMQGAWAQALMLFGQGDSATGQAAATAVQDLMTRAQDAARAGRAANQRAAQAFMDHYATLVSGVLIGMSEAFAPGAAAAKPAPARKSR